MFLCVEFHGDWKIDSLPGFSIHRDFLSERGTRQIIRYCHRHRNELLGRNNPTLVRHRRRTPESLLSHHPSNVWGVVFRAFNFKKGTESILDRSQRSRNFGSKLNLGFHIAVDLQSSPPAFRERIKRQIDKLLFAGIKFFKG